MSKSNDIFEAPPGGFRFGPGHPGATLAEELRARGRTANALALKLRVPANRITEIIAGKRGISAETALRLGRYSAPAPPSGSRCRANTISKWRRRRWALALQPR